MSVVTEETDQPILQGGGEEWGGREMGRVDVTLALPLLPCSLFPLYRQEALLHIPLYLLSLFPHSLLLVLLLLLLQLLLYFVVLVVVVVV